MSTNNKKQETSTEIAGSQFNFDDYEKEDQISSTLGETHEQISDMYYSGTIDQEVLDSRK